MLDKNDCWFKYIMLILLAQQQHTTVRIVN